MKINNEIPIPQIIFNEILAINFEQFDILKEINLLDKISSGKICCHFRFFNGKLIYPKFNTLALGASVDKCNELNDSFINVGEENFLNFQELENRQCIYCNSRKRLKKKIKFFCDFRNSHEEEINEILSFIEESEISIGLYDSVNFNNFLTGNENIENIKKIFGEEITTPNNLSIEGNSINDEDGIMLMNEQRININEFFKYAEYLLNIENGLICFLCNGLIIDDEKEIRKDEKGKTNIDIIRKCNYCKKKQENENLNLNCNIFKEKNKNKFDISKIKSKINNQENKLDDYNFINKLKLNEFY